MNLIVIGIRKQLGLFVLVGGNEGLGIVKFSFEQQKVEEEKVKVKKVVEDVEMVEVKVLEKKRVVDSKVFDVEVDKKVKQCLFEVVKVGDLVVLGYEQKVREVQEVLEVSFVSLVQLQGDQQKVQEDLDKVKNSKSQV